MSMTQLPLKTLDGALHGRYTGTFVGLPFLSAPLVYDSIVKYCEHFSFFLLSAFVWRCSQLLTYLSPQERRSSDRASSAPCLSSDTGAAAAAAMTTSARRRMYRRSASCLFWKASKARSDRGARAKLVLFS